MQCIQDIVNNTATPLWLRSIPRNVGDASAGTLKADEWHTTFTVYLPLALVSLWGDGMSHESLDDASRLCLVLDHTMALVLAITLACKWTMTQACALAYCNYIHGNLVGQLNKDPLGGLSMAHLSYGPTYL